MRREKNRFDSYQPDWEMDGVLIEVKTRLQAVRDVRDSILRLSYGLAEKTDKRAFLLLIDPRITKSRLRSEWEKIQKAFRPAITRRLSIAIFKEDHLVGIPEDPDSEDINRLEQICKKEFSSPGIPLPAPDYGAEILKILIYEWFKKRGSMTSVRLSETAGCNYRTVAKALKGPGRSILWHSDKSVELRYFPEDAWGRMLATLDRSRSTMRYADHSGQPRSIESLLRRLKRMKRTDIGIGGVLCARHYYPALDLVGTPRLDLSIHCPGKQADLDFIENLDPALKQEDDPNISANLVLHFIRREKPFFTTGPDGMIYADPVECLLDLQEMRLEPQALEFLNALKPGDEIR